VSPQHDQILHAKQRLNSDEGEIPRRTRLALSLEPTQILGATRPQLFQKHVEMATRSYSTAALSNAGFVCADDNWAGLLFG